MNENGNLPIIAVSLVIARLAGALLDSIAKTLSKMWKLSRTYHPDLFTNIGLQKYQAKEERYEVRFYFLFCRNRKEGQTKSPNGPTKKPLWYLVRSIVQSKTKEFKLVGCAQTFYTFYLMFHSKCLKFFLFSSKEKLFLVDSIFSWAFTQWWFWRRNTF